VAGTLSVPLRLSQSSSQALVTVVSFGPLNLRRLRRKCALSPSATKVKARYIIKSSSPVAFARGFFVVIKYKMVVGEYGRDYGFFLPNPVSIHPEYPRSRSRIAWCM
jgi:hypothetical protein